MCVHNTTNDVRRSGLSGDVRDVSHSTAVAFAAWYTKQQQSKQQQSKQQQHQQQQPDAGADDASGARGAGGTAFVYRLPTEQEWEYARKLYLNRSDPSVRFGPREHVLDWHGVYPVFSMLSGVLNANLQ